MREGASGRRQRRRARAGDYLRTAAADGVVVDGELGRQPSGVVLLLARGVDRCPGSCNGPGEEAALL